MSALRTTPFVACLLLTACDTTAPMSPGSVDVTVDNDRDGYAVGVDCDDAAATIHPDVVEVCNDGVDNNCDGTDDGCAYDGEVALNGDWPTISGDAAGVQAGWSVASVGDVDQDGADDFLVGAYTDDLGGPFAGAAYFFRGPVTGQLRVSEADAVITGAAPYDYAGWTVGAAGDVNDDGFPDVFVGAYGDDEGGSGAGAVAIFFGPLRRDHTTADADVRLVGAAAADSAGISAVGLGDVNGDGIDDFAVGSYGVDAGAADAGAAFVFFGPLTESRSMATADLRFDGTTDRHWFGSSLAAADVDGDGINELFVAAVGASEAGEGAGAVYMWKGPLSRSADASQAEATLLGEGAGDRFGAALANGGDTDRDGREDLLVGAPLTDGPQGDDIGAAYLFRGPLVGVRSASAASASVVGANAGDEVGVAVAGGDLDGDGFADFVIGALSDDRGAEDAGAAMLFHGPVDGRHAGRDADAAFVGVGIGDHTGYALDIGADLNGDGVRDLLIGAHGNDANGRDAGTTYVVSGRGY